MIGICKLLDDIRDAGLADIVSLTLYDTGYKNPMFLTIETRDFVDYSQIFKYMQCQRHGAQFALAKDMHITYDYTPDGVKSVVVVTAAMPDDMLI